MNCAVATRGCGARMFSFVFRLFAKDSCPWLSAASPVPKNARFFAWSILASSAVRGSCLREHRRRDSSSAWAVLELSPPNGGRQKVKHFRKYMP